MDVDGVEGVNMLVVCSVCVCVRSSNRYGKKVLEVGSFGLLRVWEIGTVERK